MERSKTCEVCLVIQAAAFAIARGIFDLAKCDFPHLTKILRKFPREVPKLLC